MPLAHQLIATVKGYSAEGAHITVQVFEGQTARAEAEGAAVELLAQGHAWTVVLDGQSKVVSSHGDVPLDRLVSARAGTRFTANGREYSVRTGCTSGMSYYPGDERKGAGTARSRSECVSFPAWRANGQPCMLTLKATTKIEFLED